MIIVKHYKNSSKYFPRNIAICKTKWLLGKMHREDGLSSRCISLLEEVKVLLENKNDSGSSASNASVPNISQGASVSSNSGTRRVGD